MTSKERVLKTINHEEPDRVPIGEWGIDHDHVSRIIGHHTYWRNRKDTTLALWAGHRDEVVESLKNDCVELTETLQYDIVTVELVPPKGLRYDDPPVSAGDGVWKDKRGNVYKYAASNDSIVCVTGAGEGKLALSGRDLEAAMNRAESLDDSVFELVDFIADRYAGEKAILFRSIDIMGFLDGPFGGDFSHQLLISLLCPEEIKRLYDACAAYNRKLLSHCRERGVSIAMQGHDFGMNTGCMISPDSIREIYMPIMARVNAATEEMGMIPFFHCCGNIWAILEDFIKAGYRGYQSIQESASMDTGRIKELYGDILTLWTGVQCETLVSGSLRDTEEEVRRNLQNLMSGGGFLFGSTNSVQFGAKTDNYLKALDVVRREGVYR